MDVAALFSKIPYVDECIACFQTCWWEEVVQVENYYKNLPKNPPVSRFKIIEVHASKRFSNFKWCVGSVSKGCKFLDTKQTKLNFRQITLVKQCDSNV